MTKSASNIHLAGYKEIFGRTEAQREQEIRQIPINELHSFAKHPFHVADDDDMKLLAESIKANGVMTPGLCRKRPEGGYEIIAGHRRTYAAMLAGLKTVPMIVRDIDDDTAVLAMVDTNLQREQILPSEKAKAYAMKYAALQHQHEKTGEGRTLDTMGEGAGDSAKTVQRYIYLSHLSDELLKMVDQKRISIVQGVDISFMSPEEQDMLYRYLQQHAVSITKTQSAKLKEYSRSKDFNESVLRLILEDEKPKKRDVTFKRTDLQKYFPETSTAEEIENVIYRLLDGWMKERNGSHGE